MSTIDLSICVLAYNHPELLPDCVASIDAQDIFCSYEKVLVDNGSVPPLPVPQGWRGVSLPQNRGNIGGMNACINLARGNYILFISNDVRLWPQCVAGLWSAMQQWNVGQLMPIIHSVDRTVQSMGLRWHWPGYGTNITTITTFTASQRCGLLIPSICFLLHKSTWEMLGGFDETLRSSHEDVDFGLRARHAGFCLSSTTVAHATHLGNATLKYTLTNPRQVFHQARLKVINKHYRGFDRLTRQWTVQVIDGVHSAVQALHGIPS